MKLETAMLFVKDFDRMTAFYRDGLGLEVVEGESQPGWVVLEAGGARFALHAIPEAIAKDIEIADPPQPRSETPIKLIFGTSDLEADRARLTGIGAAIHFSWGAGAIDLLDPEGNVFQLRAS